MKIDDVFRVLHTKFREQRRYSFMGDRNNKSTLFYTIDWFTFKSPLEIPKGIKHVQQAGCYWIFPLSDFIATWEASSIELDGKELPDG